MRKQLATFVALLLLCTQVKSQILFTYGNKPVTKEDFLRAFNKNPSQETDRKKALREYLDLYINFKLKVQAAYDARLQQDPNYALETDNFRKQLAANFINDEANVKALVDEALRRSQADIHLQQVFIAMPNEKDTVEAYRKAQQAFFDLNTGKSFANTVAKYATDPSSADLGYVTAFTLPYQYENIVYHLKPGTYAAPVRSAAGYHIFYNAGERPAVGRRKAAQILITVPPGASAAEKGAARSKADSIYRVLQKEPGKWNAMVEQFSNDLTTASNQGLMQEFGIGQFSPAFESAAFALGKPGEISSPVETGFGYHIIRLIEIIPVPKNLDDPMTAASLKERVERDDRLTEARKQLVNKWIKITGYKPAGYNQDELWAYTDSFFTGGNTKVFKNINDSTVLFSFTKQKVTAMDFAKYVRASRGIPMYQSMKYPDLLKEFIKAATTEYYQTHLGDYNADFRNQLREFNEANLLFAIMDKEVWTKSTTDDKGLRALYEANKQKYLWGPSATALIFTASNEQVLSDLQQKLKSSVNDWKTIAESFGNNVMADSNRYELGQIPVVDRTNFVPGITTAPVKNNDGSYTFAHILQVYNEPGQRSFEEARGMVINDYQAILEKEWLNALKKKYPVKVNQAVFNSIQ